MLGAVNELSAPRDVVVCAAGSMPGDLHKLWRTRDPKGYHVEYGYSCMGYEIAGGLGVRLGAPDRDVFVMVGDGSYLMMSTELVTAVQENVKVIVVLVQNHGFASIGALSESLGSQRFGTAYRRPQRATGGSTATTCRSTWPRTSRSLGVDVIEVHDRAELEKAIGTAKAADRTDRDPRGDGSADRRAGQRVLVGRPGQRGVRARLHRRPRPRRTRSPSRPSVRTWRRPKGDH